MIYLTVTIYGNVPLIIIYWKYTFDKCLSEIHIPTDVLLCTDCKCMKLKPDIDSLSRSIIMSGYTASIECIAITRSRAREVIV